PKKEREKHFGLDICMINGSGRTTAAQLTESGHQVRIKLIQENKTWEEAFRYCKENHTGLLQIKDADDQEAVKQWLTYSSAQGTFWIGLRQSRTFGFWIWRDWTVSYNQWKNNTQPEMPLSNNCGVISKKDYKWSDEECSLKKTGSLDNFQSHHSSNGQNWNEQAHSSL
uniref:C-type lectin domain-containing protein n=1 Tax=Echeneis naucrates TaxID=173247 RepID=A0A665TAM6_ECHNA